MLDIAARHHLKHFRSATEWLDNAGMQEKLGVLNGGAVYAVYDYKAQNTDELDFRCGQLLWIVRRSDEQEPHWWWATDHHSQGYVPRNLLSVRTFATFRTSKRFN
jgi:hypothetical protein